MGNVVPLGFRETEVHSAALVQLRRLTSHAKKEFWNALDVICREGPANLSRNAVIVRETPFLRKVHRLAMFISGRVIGMIEVFRRCIKLVAALDLDLLRDRERDGWVVVWARTEPRMRGDMTYDWSAALSIGPDNHLWYVQKIRRTRSDVSSTRATSEGRFEVDVRVKLRGCALMQI